MKSNVNYTIREGIARITLDATDGKVNVLNSRFLQDLDKVADALASKPGISAAVVLSAKEGGFIAGADIDEIEQVADPVQGAELAAEGQRILGRFEALPFPVVAAIHGHCMGGGTEFVLACNYRIAADDANIALPEVKLGIFPGFGGTQRLPRLVGVEKALDIILSGRTVHAKEASKINLVDRTVPRNQLEEAAIAFARETITHASTIAAGRASKRSGLRPLLLEGNPLGRALLFSLAKKSTLKKTEGHYPSPLKAIEVMRKGLAVPLATGLKIEAQGLGEMIVTPESKNLVHLFHLSQRPKKGPGVAAEPRLVQKAAVIGAGVMGGGIGWLLADKGIATVLKDIRPEAITAGIDHARKLFEKKLSKKGLGDEALAAKMTLLHGAGGDDGLGEADVVIEAVVEKMPIKQQVVQENEAKLKPEAIFASNTSALSISELQAVATHPERIGGLHFFNPVDKMPLVEVIRGAQTDDMTVATLFALAVRLGKTPIVVADRPGFLVNRLLGTYLNEACLLAEEGVDWLSLDARIKQFGMPMGPFRLIDEVSIDIAAEVGSILAAGYPWLPESGLMRRALENGLLGKKGGSGFYRYEQGHSKGPNMAAEGPLDLRKERPASDVDINRVLYLMANEAARCLEEEVVAAPEDIDTGMVFGTGFPPFRGGLCRWADRVGVEAIAMELEKLAGQYGERFSPAGNIGLKSPFYS